MIYDESKNITYLNDRVALLECHAMFDLALLKSSRAETREMQQRWEELVNQLRAVGADKRALTTMVVKLRTANEHIATMVDEAIHALYIATNRECMGEKFDFDMAYYLNKIRDAGILESK